MTGQIKTSAYIVGNQIHRMNYTQDEIRYRLELGRKPKDNTLTKKRTAKDKKNESKNRV